MVDYIIMTEAQRSLHIRRVASLNARRMIDLANARRLAESGNVDAARAILRTYDIAYAAVEVYPMMKR